MTIKEAQRKLELARKKEAQGRDDRRFLTAWLNSQGVDVDGSKARENRNQQIYKLYEKGVKTSDIAEKFGLSTGTVLHIHSDIKFKKLSKVERAKFRQRARNKNMLRKQAKTFAL